MDVCELRDRLAFLATVKTCGVETVGESSEEILSEIQQLRDLPHIYTGFCDLPPDAASRVSR